MNKVYVRINGNAVKFFETREEASKWALFYTLSQPATEKYYQYIDEAVDKSDLKDANEVIKYIMEKE